jgi:hypothetical protein
MLISPFAKAENGITISMASIFQTQRVTALCDAS